MSLSAFTRSFNAADQRVFADLCGDHNPIHMDAIAARRTQAGAPVVHGIHALLWALNSLCAEGRITNRIAEIEVNFLKFIYVGVEVTLRVTKTTSTSLHAELTAEGVATTNVRIAYATSFALAEHSEWFVSQARSAPQTPHVADISEMIGLSGAISGTIDDQLFRTFPALTENIGSNNVKTSALLSTLVGMVCPGLHSIFSGLHVRFTEAPVGSKHDLHFAVRNVDERFRMLEIAVAGAGLSGMVTAFVRLPPVTQPGMNEIKEHLSKHEFRGTNALIIGGSRGLGAITAQAIVAGGGKAVITYVVGEAEAQAIAEELGHDACRVLRYDARENAAAQLDGLPWEINQLYYFATTQIYRQKAQWYAPARFADFCRIYVDGFADVCSTLCACTDCPISVFYPSSIAIDTRPRDMTEYAMAKAAGETLCADMARSLRNLRIIVKRLPRILTDQTATVMPVQSSDPLDVMLPIIREMHAEASSLSTKRPCEK